MGAGAVMDFDPTTATLVGFDPATAKPDGAFDPSTATPVANFADVKAGAVSAAAPIPISAGEMVVRGLASTGARSLAALGRLAEVSNPGMMLDRAGREAAQQDFDQQASDALKLAPTPEPSADPYSAWMAKAAARKQAVTAATNLTQAGQDVYNSDPLQSLVADAQEAARLKSGEVPASTAADVAGKFAEGGSSLATAMAVGPGGVVPDAATAALRAVPFLGKVLKGAADASGVATTLTGLQSAPHEDISNYEKAKEIAGSEAFNVALGGVPQFFGKSLPVRIGSGLAGGGALSSGTAALEGRPQNTAENVTGALMGGMFGLRGNGESADPTETAYDRAVRIAAEKARAGLDPDTGLPLPPPATALGPLPVSPEIRADTIAAHKAAETPPHVAAAAAAGDPIAQGTQAAGDIIAEAKVRAYNTPHETIPADSPDVAKLLAPESVAARVAPAQTDSLVTGGQGSAARNGSDVPGDIAAPRGTAPEGQSPSAAGITAEPFSNGTRVLFRGDVDQIKQQLSAAGLPEGMVKREAGNPIGVYYPSSYADPVAKVLGVESPVQPTGDNVPHETSGYAQSIEPIGNGSKVLFRGDVEAMRQRLTDAGIDPGYAMVEEGAKVGVYFPKAVADKVAAVLKAPDPITDVPNVQTDAAKGQTPAPNADTSLQAGTAGRALQDSIDNDYEGVTAQYAALPDTNGGRTLNTDSARELSPEYAADRTLSATIHEEASGFIKRRYADMLAEPTPPGYDSTVLFTAGTTGAGKTTGLRALGDSVGKPEITYDTNMDSAASGIKKIDAALEAGRNVTILYTASDPVAAFGQAIKRAQRVESELGSGRSVPMDVHEKIATGVGQSMGKIAAHYQGNGRVRILTIDNTGEKGAGHFVNLADLPQVEHNGLHERLQAKLEEARQSGLSPALHAGFQPRENGKPGGNIARGVEPANGAGGDRQPQPQRAGRAQGQVAEPLASERQGPADAGLLHSGGGPKPVSTKEASMQAARVARGEETLPKVPMPAHEQEVADARQRMADNPHLADGIVARKLGGDHTISAADEAVLQAHAVDLTNQMEAQAKHASDPNAGQAERDLARQKGDELAQRFNDLNQATKITGAAWSHFGRQRMQELLNDYSFAALVRKETTRQQRPLSTDEVATIKQQADTIAQLQKEAETHAQALKDALADKAKPSGPKKSLDERAQARLRVDIANLEQQIRQRLSACPV